MADQEFYDLVFKGELAKGADLVPTKANIGKLFNIAPERVDALFSGRAVTLKKHLDFEAANRYRAAIKKAGARVDLVVCQNSVVQKMASVGDAVSETASAHSGSVSNPSPVNSSSDVKGLSLRGQGGNLLDDGEIKKAEALNVDISKLSLAEAGEDLLRPEEKAKPKVVSVNTEKFSLEEPGAN